MKIRMVNGGGDDKIFCDFKNRKKTEQKEFMTRMFLVEGGPGIVGLEDDRQFQDNSGL